MSKLRYERESYLIRKAIYEVYKAFRNHHKELVYHNALMELLNQLGLQAEKDKRLSVRFHGKVVGTYVPDIVINGRIFMELKRKPFLTSEDKQQFWDYLRATGYSLGFLVNFGKTDGVEIIRKVYGYDE